jgi:integrase
MKAREAKARPHAVPITSDSRALLAELPRPRAGKFLFSTTGGAKPVWISDKIKKKLDARMLRSLKALARMQGRDPEAVTLPKWKNHDLRRTVRSGLSRLRIPEEVREAVLAHVRPGIKKTYDLYDYFDEKRDALEKWAGLLQSIVNRPASNVVRFSAATDSGLQPVKRVHEESRGPASARAASCTPLNFV